MSQVQCIVTELEKPSHVLHLNTFPTTFSAISEHVTRVTHTFAIELPVCAESILVFTIRFFRNVRSFWNIYLLGEGADMNPLCRRPFLPLYDRAASMKGEPIWFGRRTQGEE